MNQVALIGNLTRDPELRHTRSGATVCEFAIAVNDRKPDGQGGWEDYPHYIDIVTWNRQAETCAEFLAKGRKVGVTGKIVHDRWETDTGEKRSRHRVVALQVDFLTPKGEGNGFLTSKVEGNGYSGGSYSSGAAPAADFTPSAADDDIPF